MSYFVPPTSLQSTERRESRWRRYAFRCHAYQLVVTWPTGNSPHTGYTASIDILDDDSLLNIFYLYRPFLFREDEDHRTRLIGADKGWVRSGHWWFKLSHVCQRWRNLILASSSYLDLCLVCTKGTPVADMLAHSPPLPLLVDYHYKDPNMNTEDEEGLILALEQRGRVRRIRLRIYMPNMQRLIMAVSEEYPILEYLIIVSPDWPRGLALPETLQAPHLHHLMLSGFALPIGCRLLTTAAGLVTLALAITTPFTYVEPNALLQWISFMPRLETLMVVFLFAVPSHTIERQVTLMPIITPITLPNLRWFWFQGVNAYLEVIVRMMMSAPRLEGLQVFFEQLTFSVPHHLLQFMNTAENLRFSNAKLDFSGNQVDVVTYPHDEEVNLSQCFLLRVVSCHLDWQVSTVAQICNSLNQVFSAVEHLTLEYHREKPSRINMIN